ncbi:zinc finger protein 239-like isoform X1 [Dermacentor silvarum]|uniref:zinc finger protein 239-like isoform X1 n=1 Tax=Dermacentor silvarum TaxID=543639 RepID=UPI001898BF8C|nr:zinc finger protein 239-like isoform X1 [Dermacentor silvarum]
MNRQLLQARRLSDVAESGAVDEALQQERSEKVACPAVARGQTSQTAAVLSSSCQELPTTGTKRKRGSATMTDSKKIPDSIGACSTKLRGKDAAVTSWECHVCQKILCSRWYLRAHMRVHAGTEPHACTVCGKKFALKGSLVLHNRMHTGEKPHKCSLCPAAFAHSANLNKHVLTHSGERPHECEECGRKFATRSHLVTHTRTHTGEQPWACEECGRRFSVRSNLVCHLRLHSGERPYVCHLCPATFSQKSHLNTHIRAHTQEKPYECQLCLKKFARHENVMSHVHRAHYAENPSTKAVSLSPSSACTPWAGKILRTYSRVGSHGLCNRARVGDAE